MSAVIFPLAGFPIISTPPRSFMSHLPYSSPPDPSRAPHTKNSYGDLAIHYGPLLLTATEKELDSDVVPSTMKPSFRDNEIIGSTRNQRKMQYTTPLQRPDPSLQILPSRRARGIQDPTVASTRDLAGRTSMQTDWAETLRRRRNASAGHTPFTSNKRTYYAMVRPTASL